MNPTTRLLCGWTRAVRREYAETHAPVTNTFTGVIIGLYLVEIGYTVKFGLQSTEIFATGLFGVSPVLAWPLAPFLHKDATHLIGNLTLFWMIGNAVERHWSKWWFLAFLLVTGYVSTFIGAALMLSFSSKDVAWMAAE